MTDAKVGELKAGTWQHAFAQQPFRKKLSWLPNLSAAALAIGLCVTGAFGIINGRRLATIEHGHYPLMLASQSLQVSLSELQRDLQDAVAASDYFARAEQTGLDADLLLAVRNGAWSFERLMEFAANLDSNLEELYAKSSLPRSPDTETIDRLCIEAVEAWL
jgi:hypothetical protein